MMAVGLDAVGQKERDRIQKRLEAYEAALDDFIMSSTQTTMEVPLASVCRNMTDVEWQQIAPKYEALGWSFHDDPLRRNGVVVLKPAE